MPPISILRRSRLARSSFPAALALGALGLWPSAPSAQEPAPQAPKLKDEQRTPWSRNDAWFLKSWLVAGPVAATLEADALAAAGGEAAVRPKPGAESEGPGGAKLRWRETTSWGDAVSLEDALDLRSPESGVAFAFALVKRAVAGPVLLSVGSDDGIRVWVNGALVHEHKGPRPLVHDEDRALVPMVAGENALLVKVEQRRGPWTFSLRVVEPGAALAPEVEIGPAVLEEEAGAASLVVRSDVPSPAPGGADVAIDVVAPGGTVVASRRAPRGRKETFDPSAWGDGPYEVRFTTRTTKGKNWTTHLPWLKGDARAQARKVVDAAKSVDGTTPLGRTRRMLADLVLDRAGGDLDRAGAEGLRRTHSALMESAELDLEAAGRTGRVRPFGFARLAWVDEVDGSVQFCRAYLPPGYRSDGKAPLIVQLHGFNPANPEYVRWWSIDNRHHPIQEIDRGADSPIYLEPHGRGNTQYQGFGEKDVLRAIAEAKKLFAVDDDRVYLTGDSMGGWGVWQVATRNPGVFAAVAPVFGGADYRAQFDEAFLGKLNAPERFLWERRSSFAQAEALSNLPVLVSHGDADRAVNVEYSRSALRMLQRWGYDVRYHELPGRGHEDMKVAPGIWDWFLRHRRVAEPLRVKVRAADLQSAAAYWVRLVRAERPMEFLVADAEVVGPHRIRLDTRNVAAAELRPGSLVDPSRAVEVVWNGVSRSVTPKAGLLDLGTGAPPPRGLEKTPQVAGPFADVTNTPYAVVTGTIARDPAMRRMCALKAQAFVANWRNWQKVRPRVFEDVRLTDADAARYSLLLIGGPDDNAAARRLAARLPLAIRPDAIAIDGKAFPVKDAGVALVYPSPLNPERYVAVVAGTSPGGLWFADPMDRQAADWDFVITDGRGASAAAHVGPGPFPERGRVVSGYFDSAWKVDEALLVWGDAEARAKASVMAAPRPVTLPPLALDRVAGTYAIPQGPRIRVFRESGRLLGGQEGQVPGELVPESETSFFLAEPYMRIVFEKDAAGKAVAFQLKRPGREARAPRVE